MATSYADSGGKGDLLTETSSLLGSSEAKSNYDGVAEDSVAFFEEEKRKAGLGFAGFWSCALILTKTIIGAGVIGTPKALASSGYMLGAVLFFVFGSLSALTCHFMHRVTLKLGIAPATFTTVCSRLMPRWVWLVNTALLAGSLGTMCTLLIVIGGALPAALTSLGWPGLGRRHAVLLGYAVAMPLTLFRHLNGLRYVAALSLSVCVWTALLTIIYSTRRVPHFMPCATIEQTLPCDGAHIERGPADFHHFGKYVCTIILAFACQSNVFTVFNEIKGATPARADKIIGMSHLVAGTVYYFVAFCTYAIYGTAVSSNMLNSYPADIPMTVTRLLYIIVCVVSYPIFMNPCRLAAWGLWRSVTDMIQEAKLPLPSFIVEPAGYEAPASNFKFFVTTLSMEAVSLVVALLVEDLGSVTGIIGATASIALAYVIPAFLYMKAFEEPHFKRTLAAGTFSFGCVMMPVCVVGTLMR